jgi:membrane glycosyltransferase
MAGSALPVLAGADRLLADPVAVRVGDFQPFNVGLRTKRWKLFLIPEEYSPPQVLVDTDAYLT